MEGILNTAQYLMDQYQQIAHEPLREEKLQLLLYFAQRESIAINGQPLFSEEMVGRQNGPFSQDVQAYLNGGGSADSAAVSLDAGYILNNVIEEYGRYAIWSLRKMACKQSSWRNARRCLDPAAGDRPLLLEDIRKDAAKIRPYDHVWEMYYDEFAIHDLGGSAV